MNERGYGPTSVEDVIREAGLSGKSHFYHYFPSKEALGYEVLERQFERFTERGLAILREPMIAPLERLGLFVDSLVALQADRGGRGGGPLLQPPPRRGRPHHRVPQEVGRGVLRGERGARHAVVGARPPGAG